MPVNSCVCPMLTYLCVFVAERVCMDLFVLICVVCTAVCVCVGADTLMPACT